MRNSYNTNLLFRNFVLLVLISILSISGCNNNNNGNKITLAPSLIMAPNANAPLAGLLELATSGFSRVSVTLSSNLGEQMKHDYEELNTEHSLPVLGFKPERTYIVTVNVFGENGKELTQPVTFEVTTDPLPLGFPEINVTSTPELMEPGVTLFETAGFLIAVDATGDVCWFYDIQLPSESFDRDVRRMNNGNLLLLLPRFRMIELDMLGNIINMWHPSGSTNGDPGSIPVDTLAFHHEVYEMESGNFLMLSVEFENFLEYPTSVINPSAPLDEAIVVGDVVVEFTPDGTVVNEWSTLDMLDPFRLNYSSLLGLYDNLYETVFGVAEETVDWSHGNAVIHDPRDDSIIVSYRHQDAVVKFSRQTGELIWILGPPENWDPEPFGQYLLTPISDQEFFFPYHQHAPDITDEDTIIIFDNGNNRASPFDPILPNEENFSRAVEYKINKDTKEIELVWEYGQFEKETLFTFFIGDADYLPNTGNALITFGGTQPARLIEVTRTTPAIKVFDLSLPVNFTYRSERLPSLYPDQY